jgi:hypothetical protein
MGGAGDTKPSAALRSSIAESFAAFDRINAAKSSQVPSATASAPRSKSPTVFAPGSESYKHANVYHLQPTENISMSRKEFTSFIEKIKAEGIKEPICYVEVDGTKYVVDGHHRLKAAKT